MTTEIVRIRLPARCVTCGCDAKAHATLEIVTEKVGQFRARIVKVVAEDCSICRSNQVDVMSVTEEHEG